MKNTNLYFLILLLFVLIKPINAQDHDEHNEESHHEGFYPHTLGAFIGFTFIPNTLSSGQNEMFVAPTLGLSQ